MSGKRVQISVAATRELEALLQEAGPLVRGRGRSQLVRTLLRAGLAAWEEQAGPQPSRGVQRGTRR